MTIYWMVRLPNGNKVAMTSDELEAYHKRELSKEQQGETMEDETVSTMPTGEQK